MQSARALSHSRPLQSEAAAAAGRGAPARTLPRGSTAVRAVSCSLPPSDGGAAFFGRYVGHYSSDETPSLLRQACEMIVIRVGEVLHMAQGARVAKRQADKRLREAEVTPRAPELNADAGARRPTTEHATTWSPCCSATAPL
jgi:hypothetical protein